MTSGRLPGRGSVKLGWRRRREQRGEKSEGIPVWGSKCLRDVSEARKHVVWIGGQEAAGFS